MRPRVLKRDLRHQLFMLFAGWSGELGRPFGSHVIKTDGPFELERTAVGAMVSVLCCGPCFYKESLTEDSNSDIYMWLDLMLASKNEKVPPLGPVPFRFIMMVTFFYLFNHLLILGSP